MSARLHDIAHERNRRLERADANISRCGECGAWQWRAVCTTDHDKARVELDASEDASLDVLLGRVWAS